MKSKPKRKKAKQLPPRWNAVPVLRMLLGFVAGIIFQIFTLSDFKVSVIVSAVFFVLITGLTFYRKISASYKYRWLFGFALTVIFFFTGILVTYLKSENNYPNHFSKFIKSGNTYIARITEPAVEKTSSVKLILEILGYRDASGFHDMQGHLLTYIQKDTNALNLKYGQVIVFNGSIQDIKPPFNPGQFNYKRFLYFHQIFQQVYLRNNNWQLAHDYKGNWIFDKSYNLREQLVNVFKKYLGSKREYAVASALTVGYEDDIDQELIQAYASSGALHVLSVSGMHVGLIYLVLTTLLVFLDKIRGGKHIKYACLLIFLWFYTILTGMSPSVMRSAVMLTVVIAGQWLMKRNNIYNTLALSVFFLLCFNPFYITEVGFQLSYLAVFGIVFLHPYIFKWFEPGNLILSQVWKITSVSLAAQTATFPIGLLYFHQFPLLFIISNLFIIPLATIVIFSSILLLFLSFFNFIFFIDMFLIYFGKLIFSFVWLINRVALFVDQLSISVISGISITIFETFIIYLMLFFSVAFLIQKRALQLQLLLACVLILLTTQFIETIRINNQKQFIVYSIKNHSAINFIDHRNNYFLTDTVLSHDKSAMLFNITHYWWDCGVHDWQTPGVYASAHFQNSLKNFRYRKNFIQFYNQKFIVVDSTLNFISFNNPAPAKFNYAIVSINSANALKELLRHFSFNKIIIDSSNDYKNIRKIRLLCSEYHIPFYDVNESGAFVAEF